MPNTAGFCQIGAIVKMHLKNFMTYDDCTVDKPGPNLNMILGPNGSGKSAIVCAIIVGLAGDVSLTHRGASPAHLVQRGRDHAITRIELYNDSGPNFIVERKIIITNSNCDKLEHKSEWRLNRRVVLQAEIKKLMAKLNIKVDNLCQFLPQDSVASFVKLSSSDLLTNTLKAAGDNTLVEQHTNLIEYSEKISESKKKLNNLQEACQQNRVNARRLENEVEKLREREEMIKKKSICEQKVHYVRYLEAKKDYANGEAELNTMQQLLETAKNNAEPYRRNAEICKEDESRLKGLIDGLGRETELAADRLKRVEETIRRRKTECQDEFASFRGKQSQEQQREQDMRLQQQECDSLECRLNEIRNVDYGRDIANYTNKIGEVRRQLSEIDRTKLELGDERRRIIMNIDQNEKERARMIAVKQKKIEHLRSKQMDSHIMIEWLSKNRDKFEGKITLPMLCEINVLDPKNAGYLESIINESDLFAFVCEKESDLRKFTQVFRERKLKVNVILMPDQSSEELQMSSRNQRDSVTRRMKPNAFLKDFIQAPEPIMRFLCGQHDIHNIPVFYDDQADLQYLLNNCRRFFVGNRLYSVTKSRYDNEPIIATEPIREPRHLIHTLDSKGLERNQKAKQELEAKKQELAEKELQLNSEHDDLTKESHQLSTHLRSLKAKSDEKRRVMAMIDICKDKIRNLQTDKIDLVKAKSDLQSSVQRINKDMMKDLTRMGQVCEDYVEAKKNSFLNNLLCSLANRNYRIAKARYHASLDDTHRLEGNIRSQKEKNGELRKKADNLRKFAEDKVHGFSNGVLDKKTKRIFESVDLHSVDEIEQQIEELKIRIRNICHDSSVVNDFNRENAELREKQKQIMGLEKDVERKEFALNEIKQTWLPKLNEVLSIIDEHYQDFMQRLSYGGKVVLDYDVANPNDFKSYGIVILVKYRDNEELIPLTSTRQSGGERSVATMIYMLALQTITTVPFRVVDEINQGMDSDNERKVFELLVKVADESSSQYFLVSPKLLSGLEYGDKMQIHVVFNGKNMDYKWAALYCDGGNGNNSCDSDTGNESDATDDDQ